MKRLLLFISLIAFGVFAVLAGPETSVNIFATRDKTTNAPVNLKVQPNGDGTATLIVVLASPTATPSATATFTPTPTPTPP